MKQYFLPVLILLGGFGLLGAAVDSGLPDDYWNIPAATKFDSPHGWSKLETDLHPEACTQCHAEQFDAWKHSLHAAAYSSGMIGQFPSMGHEGANDCLQCHAPLAEQLYTSQPEMMDSIALRLKHPQGFDSGSTLDVAKDDQTSKLPLRHAGVTCASCHVRGWQRNGPPQRGSGAVGHVESQAHGGFNATRDFEQSQFCASCHQFPQSMAINGKPLENTLEEWKQSPFFERGVTCQQCHMPDRKHEFKGIHDPAMVRKGVEFGTNLSRQTATLTIASVWVGHAFPTYVTPKVEVHILAEDSRHQILTEKRWQISRIVEYENGWIERSDTRLMPGEERVFALTQLPEETQSVRFVVDVVPDHFYKAVYDDLLAGDMQANARKLIERSNHSAGQNDYRLYDEVRDMP